MPRYQESRLSKESELFEAKGERCRFQKRKCVQYEVAKCAVASLIDGYGGDGGAVQIEISKSGDGEVTLGR